jgi:signal recognition particle receptor subunit beta
MALLDEKRDALVVRIVYDGPPFSGKTTTLRKLSEGLARTLETPEEHDGRTLFFDWLDYTAGRFEGRPIRCQVVSVPGQRSLVERRRLLLKDADSVVFVADTGALGMELSLKYARELSSVIAAIAPPRPAVVIQANKRDVEDALPIPKVVEQFRSIGLETALIETTAKDGAGVREAFLFGVRLALDRVRELSGRGQLKNGRPDVDSSGDLLRLLGEDSERSPTVPDAHVVETPSTAVSRPKVEEQPSPGLRPGLISAVDVVREALAAEQGAVARAGREPAAQQGLPDPSVPSGFIWPPIEGRVIVQQALVGSQKTIKTLSSGDHYVTSPNGWRVHSRANDVFDDQNAARSALIEWARLHVRNQNLLTDRRCVVLSPDGERWRLWQIVGSARSLDDFLTQEVRGSSVRQAAEALLVAATKIAAAAASFGQATIELIAALGTVSADSADTKYVGLMPGPESQVTPVGVRTNAPTIVADRMGWQVQRFAERFGESALMGELELLAKTSPDKRLVAANLVGAIRAYKVS